MANILERIKNGWNAFKDQEPSLHVVDVGPGSSWRPDRNRLHLGNERSIVASIVTRIGIDAAAIPLLHARLDENGSFIETVKSGLNNCLTVEANVDQTGRSFMQDVVMSLCDEGVVAIVPVDMALSPRDSATYDILSMRTGRILQWFPQHIRVEVYDERTGLHKEIMVSKRQVAIVENPLYAVMNEPNSTLKRLVSKLNLLDVIDSQSGSGKLDIIIQLPYVVKTTSRREQAEIRRADIEKQLADSKYGIAYTDATEKITQLNRPAENNLMEQIEYLTRTLYGQLGLDEAVFNGSADEKVMLNYYNRTIEPILSAIAGSINKSFLSKTARTQGQSVIYQRKPFAMVPISDIGTLADSLTRNEIVTSNEFRAVLGMRPSQQESADELRNKNLNPTITDPNLQEGNTNGSE